MPTETVISVLFYLFAVLAVVLASAAVTTRRILRAAVFLAGVLVISAGFYLLLDMEFLAGIQLLVYVGGIVVLLVFAVMLTSSADFLETRPSLKRKFIAAAAAASFFVLTVTSVYLTAFPLDPAGKRPESDVKEIGRRLFDPGPDGFVLPFELVSLLLLAALIGGVVVARKKDGARSPEPQEELD